MGQGYFALGPGRETWATNPDELWVTDDFLTRPGAAPIIKAKILSGGPIRPNSLSRFLQGSILTEFMHSGGDNRVRAEFARLGARGRELGLDAGTA